MIFISGSGQAKKSFTLTEMIIVITILALLSTMLYQILRGSSKIKEKISISVALREDVLFLIEKISREVRMAQEIKEKNTKDSNLHFINQEGKDVLLYRCDSVLNPKNDGRYLCRCEEGSCEIISSNDIEISSLFFEVNNFCLPGEVCVEFYQPYIKIFIEAKKRDQKFHLQTTITPRIYVTS